jgi:hypothetical protein
MRDDDEVTKLPTTTVHLDGFEGCSDEVEGGDEQEKSSNRVIHGELVKFTNEATWITGAGEELAPELELIVIDIGRVVQKWHEGSPVETIVLAPGEKFPDVKKLNATVPQELWEEGPDGRPRGPWQAQYVVYLLNPRDMSRYSWPTGTTGGGICVREDLRDRVQWMRRFRGANVYPVVRLTDTFMNTRYGGRQRPSFEIVKWITLDGGDGGGDALPAPNPPKLPPQGAQAAAPAAAAPAADNEEDLSARARAMKLARQANAGMRSVEKPSAKEVTDDEIPF